MQYPARWYLISKAAPLVPGPLPLTPLVRQFPEAFLSIGMTTIPKGTPFMKNKLATPARTTATTKRD